MFGVQRQRIFAKNVLCVDVVKVVVVVVAFKPATMATTSSVDIL